MQFIQISRQNYIGENENSFKNTKDKKSYMQDWVANYEISDYMLSLAQKKKFKNVFFFR